MTDYFRAGKYGKLFLEKLQEEIEGLEFTPDGSDLYPFRESDELIQRGYEAKEPALLYLNAEIQRHGAGMSDETILNLYVEAAQLGQVLLRCFFQEICKTALRCWFTSRI